MPTNDDSMRKAEEMTSYCPSCKGDGYTVQHADTPHENGSCDGYCPVQVECETCHASGKIIPFPLFLQALSQTEAEAYQRGKSEVEKERIRLLYALCLMYDQYCADIGHLFMVAGEVSSTLLEKEGLLVGDEAGAGEINWERYEKMEAELINSKPQCVSKDL